MRIVGGTSTACELRAAATSAPSTRGSLSPTPALSSAGDTRRPLSVARAGSWAISERESRSGRTRASTMLVKSRGRAALKTTWSRSE